MSSNVDLNVRPGFDGLVSEIADYVSSYKIKSDLALDTARNCLIDTIGCGLLALQFPACTKMLGPIVKNTKVPFGVRVPGTLTPKGTLVSFTIGPSIFVQAGNCSAKRPHPMVSIRQFLAVSKAKSDLIS